MFLLVLKEMSCPDCFCCTLSILFLYTSFCVMGTRLKTTMVGGPLYFVIVFVDSYLITAMNCVFCTNLEHFGLCSCCLRIARQLVYMLVHITFPSLVKNTIEGHTSHFSFDIQVELDLPIIQFLSSFLH